jgi:VCBS repeat protein
MWAQFETRATTKLPQGAFAIAAGDFNHDGFADVVVIDDNGFTVSLGKGDGTFRKPVFYKSQLSYSLAVGDFNNDGNLDIVVANLVPSTVDVYLGNGDGTFKAPISSNTTDGSYFVAPGDFNHDGKLDIAIIDGPNVSILLGNGNGTFGVPSDNDSFYGAQWLAVGDFNNDHKLDVLTSGRLGSDYYVAVLLGNGDGTLQDAIDTPVEYITATVAAGDMNGDGNLDAVLGDDLDGVAVLLGNGDGSFQPPVYYNTTGIGGGEVIVADLNLNGKLDVVVPSGVGVDVFWGNGDGTLQSAQFLRSGETGLPALGDLNGDGLPDLALANASYTTTMLNTGVVGFSPTTPLSFDGPGEQTLKLTNKGTTALSISSMKASGAFKVRDTCGKSVPAGASCGVNILFEPNGAGTYTGLITLMDSASSKPQFIPLSGGSN